LTVPAQPSFARPSVIREGPPRAFIRPMPGRQAFAVPRDPSIGAQN
jgi:hypothetical protein